MYTNEIKHSIKVQNGKKISTYFISIFLSSISIGIGHIFLGKIKRGISFFIFYQLFMWSISLFATYLPYKVDIIIYYSAIIIFRLLCIGDTLNALLKNKFLNTTNNRWYIFTSLLILFTLVLQPINNFLISKHICQIYRVASSGMVPTFSKGERIVVDKRNITNLDINDIIVFKEPESDNMCLKRIIALGNDTIRISNDTLFKNNRLLNGDNVNSKAEKKISSNMQIVVPINSYFLLGDSYGNSYDSRHFGVIKQSAIVGKVKDNNYSSYTGINL